MIAERYSQDKLNTSIQRGCFFCEGKGSYSNNGSGQEDICELCEGKGKLVIELELCPGCNSVVPEDNKMWVNDINGIPYKKVCFDCVDKTKKERENCTLNYNNAG